VHAPSAAPDGANRRRCRLGASLDNLAAGKRRNRHTRSAIAVYMKHHDSKQIMSHLQELTDAQKRIGMKRLAEWSRLPWVKIDDMWTCEFLQMQTSVHPLNFAETNADLASDVLDICKQAGMESPTEMRLLPGRLCETHGCERVAQGHICQLCNCTNYCGPYCMGQDKARHTRAEGQISECMIMGIVVKSWDQWQKFMIRYAAGKPAADILDMIENYGDEWLCTAEEDLLSHATVDLLLYASPAASGRSMAAACPLAAPPYSMQTILEVKKWQIICMHMIAISVEASFQQWVHCVPWNKSKLLRLMIAKSVDASFQQWVHCVRQKKSKPSRIAASLSAAATETKLAELRAAVAAAAQRERSSSTQRTEEQKQLQALQSRLAEVHNQLAEEKKQRAEEQKQRAEEQQQRAEEQRLLAEVNSKRAATERELQRTQNQLGRLQTRLETALAAERHAASALVASVSGAAGKDIFDTKHCPVCFHDTQDTAVIPCGHTFCGQCAYGILAGPKRECHSCRGPVAGVLRLFVD
jgi:hypothetical protein